MIDLSLFIRLIVYTSRFYWFKTSSSILLQEYIFLNVHPRPLARNLGPKMVQMTFEKYFEKYDHLELVNLDYNVYE